MFLFHIPVGTTNVTFKLVFLNSNGIVKIFLETMGMKKISIERLLYWPEVNQLP